MRNAAEAGATNVEFLKGQIEQIPLPAETVDVIISNCVVNLSPDKAAVLSEAFRVLRPGGRLGISDVVAEDRLSRRRARRARRLGGLHRGRPLDGRVPALLAAAGFRDVESLHPRGGRRPARRDRRRGEADRRTERAPGGDGTEAQPGCC